MKSMLIAKEKKWYRTLAEYQRASSNDSQSIESSPGFIEAPVALVSIDTQKSNREELVIKRYPELVQTD